VTAGVGPVALTGTATGRTVRGTQMDTSYFYFRRPA
jgi:hypothetical protein